MNVINEIFKALEMQWVKTAYLYCISSKYRKSVKVHKWLKEQLEEEYELLQAVLVENKLIGKNDDDTVIRILRWVHHNITYTSDTIQYKESEKWATVAETLVSNKGDCEDGAVLIFCLARVAGVPANQIKIAAGDVSYKGSTAGHCWVRYVSKQFPFVSVYLDWCYYYDYKDVTERAGYVDMYKRGIVSTKNKYKRLWFTSNDETSYVVDVRGI